MFAKLDSIERNFEELELELASPDVFNDQEHYTKLTKMHADLGAIVKVYREYRQMQENLSDNREMLDDDDQEIRDLAKAEIDEIETRLPELEHELKLLLLPKDPMDEKNIILEIRAGTGGEEAALFASDLFRMYMRFAEHNGWKTEMMSSNETGSGGYKEVIASISGERVYSRLKYESGIHRVQRVPATESQGRIHTSACTVAIMPEAEEVELNISPEDLRIDVYRSSGPGGQSVNTTDSAIRVTHLPTGLVVTCQDEKSQHKNKAKALTVLRSRLFQMEQDRIHQEQADTRRAQVGSGDRSGRIRTYNFPQGRITDHRINLTLYRLEEVLGGDLEEIVESLVSHYQAEALRQQAEDA
ncbi:peptide chain release factor 1 [Desulfobaculum bizertense]|uniref:Peptide chain release factor 1 n=1 Tax=Desulfobaculum bizertense DSM 18034 TaxID=1121442 RepID=A0A1T4WFI8_9BACT|nr:peptide chain release factor 1 [Desulfobaculum bizertense]UIJ36688.1 peptide chain release factor 1 [Desulfobaculum bizertense]SKA75919.1 peptide chain release factor 1 [Desulfobaculum bizertense DSM 18034]